MFSPDQCRKLFDKVESFLLQQVQAAEQQFHRTDLALADQIFVRATTDIYSPDRPEVWQEDHLATAARAVAQETERQVTQSLGAWRLTGLVRGRGEKK